MSRPLTARGRDLLLEKVADLRAVRLPDALASAVAAPEIERLSAEYVRLLDELRAHELLLSESRTVGGKAKPDVVELGDLVTIEFVVTHGLRRRRTVERYLLLQSAEARLDRLCISVDSPLGRAVLGQPVGTHVKVRTRSSRYTARVVATEGAPRAC